MALDELLSTLAEGQSPELLRVLLTQGGPCSAFMRQRVFAIGKQPARLQGLLTGALQGHDREAPETHPVLPAYERVAKKPTTRARRLNQQIKPVAVAMGASRGGAAFNIGQPYRVLMVLTDPNRSFLHVVGRRFVRIVVYD